MSSRLLDRAAGALARRTSRRGFLNKSALVGTALVVDPRRFALQPISAYAAACSCAGQSCPCGSMCCDGYTEFCCTITGRNQCPPGTALGGWWKADGSGYCGGPRYYMDCNVVPPASPCGCGCANGNCGHRKACCTNFRYGQCHQEIGVMGAIMCRVVTCTPPWEFDATCTRTVLIDQSTRTHDAPCLHQDDEEEDDMPPAPAICIDPSGRRWVFLRGVDGALWGKVDNGAWFTLGGILTSGPDAVAHSNGRIDVVVRGQDGATYMQSYDGNVWLGWQHLGGLS
jgi:hypothetical protein